MRKDMSKVVIERPRRGHYLPSVKTRWRMRRYDEEEIYDELPQRVSGSRSKHLENTDTKDFSDLLGPLRKYLRKQVGRPWNAVHSEIAQTLDRRKVTGQHIFEHVSWEVELHAEIDAGGVAFTQGYAGRYAVRGLYVHPRTGLLCWQEGQRGKYVSPEEQKRSERQTLERKQISYDQSYVRINGVWYVGDYLADDDSPPPVRLMEVSPPERHKFTEFGTRYWNGKRWMRLHTKRKCTHQEMQKAGLRNAKQRESGLWCFRECEF